MLPFNWDTVKRNSIEWLCCQTVCLIKRILDLSQCKYRVQQLNNTIVLVLVGGFRHNTQKNMRVSWKVYQHNNAKHCISWRPSTWPRGYANITELNGRLTFCDRISSIINNEGGSPSNLLAWIFPVHWPRPAVLNYCCSLRIRKVQSLAVLFLATIRSVGYDHQQLKIEEITLRLAASIF